MKIEDAEFGALVAGPRDTLVIALPSGTEPKQLERFAEQVRLRLGHERVLVVAGAEAIVAMRDTAGPCMDRAPEMFPDRPSYLSCTLTAGHAGGHTDGSATWRYADDSSGRAALAEVNEP